MKRLLRRACVTLGVLALLPAWASAQEPTQVRGRVTNAETDEPLAGVQISVLGTGVGALSSAEGTYSLQVPEGGEVLVFTSLGYETQEVPITGSVMNVALQTTAISVEGIVVTALGIEQRERAMATAVAEIGSHEFVDAPETNIVNALAGEVAGVTTTAAGPAGGSARIVVRGANSVSGNNQPLFVVDGIPIDNSAPDLDGFGSMGETYDYGNAAGDLNPSDIESVSVLKGPNAAALYGSRASNGAIVITTKDGRGAPGTGASQITYQSNVYWTNPLRLPEYQNKYGQGYAGEYSFVDGLGGGINDFADESWGPPCDGREIVQWWSNGEPAPFECQPNNVESFFDTGLTTYNNIAFAAANEQANVRLSVSNQNIEGMDPGFQSDQWNLSVNGGAAVSERLRVDGAVNYVRRHGESRPGIGYTANNYMQQFVWFGRTLSMDRLKQAYFDNAAENQHVTWNPTFHTNPYWISLQNDNVDDRNRIIGHASTSYELSDGVTATARVGTDWYQDERKVPIWYDGTSNAPYDAFFEELINRSETNYDLLVNINRTLTPDISLNATVGGNHRYTKNNFHDVSVEELTVPGIFSVENAARPPVANDELQRSAMNSLFGQAQFGFRNFVFLNVTGRNDWSSTLPEANNSYFYPSISGSFIFTDAFDLGFDALSFGKVRASWARVGSDTDPYQLAAYYASQEAFNGDVPAFAVPDQIPNLDLKPQQTESWEFGLDVRFFGDRLGLDATYYDQVTYDQILSTDISATSGFYSQLVNAGDIANRGVELRLSSTPIMLDNGFRWDLALNYAKNENEVVRLAEGLETFVLDSYWQVTTEAREDYAYGTMFGLGIKRDSKGRKLVSEDGLWLPTDTLVALGNYTPDWTGGLSSTFSYGGFELGFLLDTRQGGELFSVTQMFGLYSGVLEESLVGREESFGSTSTEDGGVAYQCEPGIVLDGYTVDRKSVV